MIHLLHDTATGGRLKKPANNTAAARKKERRRAGLDKFCAGYFQLTWNGG